MKTANQTLEMIVEQGVGVKPASSSESGVF